MNSSENAQQIFEKSSSLPSQVTFQYDWDSDANCDINEEILSEDCSSNPDIKIHPLSMNVHSSIASFKMEKEGSNKDVDNSDGRTLSNLLIVKRNMNKKRCLSSAQPNKSNGACSSVLSINKPRKTIKEEISELLKLLVIKNKNDEFKSNQNPQNSEISCALVSVKDIQQADECTIMH